jgi:hypothetical protein
LNERVDKEEVEDITVPSKEELISMLMDRKTIFLSAMDTRLKDFSKTEKFFILSRELTGFGNLLDNFKKALKEWQDNENRIIILAGTENKAKNLAKELEEDEYFIADLIGCEVYQDELIGVVEDIFTAGASDVYVIKRKNKKDLLLPALADVIKKVDVENKKIYVEVPRGLEDDEV